MQLAEKKASEMKCAGPMVQPGAGSIKVALKLWLGGLDACSQAVCANASTISCVLMF